MVRKERRPAEARKPEQARRLEGLLESGDHRGAAALARRVLADAGATEDDRAAARSALARVAIEPWAIAAGLAGLVFFLLAAYLGLHH